MGKRNKSVNLTLRKIRYVIRSKTANKSTKKVAAEMKVSISTVKRVWVYWLKNREVLPIKKSGRKKEPDDETRAQIIAIHKEQKLGARRLEMVLEYKHDKHIPHNAIHQALLEERLAGENKERRSRED